MAVAYQGIPMLEVGTRWGAREFQGVKVQRKTHETVKTVSRVSSHYDWIDPEMALLVSGHSKPVYWLSCLRMRRKTAYYQQGRG